MAEYAIAAAPYPGVNTPYKRGVLLPVVVSFASGVPSIVTAASAPGFTITGTAGAYTGTMPIASRGLAYTQILQTTAAGAIANFTAFSATAGTFSVETHTGDTTSGAEALADTDQLWMFFLLEAG